MPSFSLIRAMHGPFCHVEELWRAFSSFAGRGAAPCPADPLSLHPDLGGGRRLICTPWNESAFWFMHPQSGPARRRSHRGGPPSTPACCWPACRLRAIGAKAARVERRIRATAARLQPNSKLFLERIWGARLCFCLGTIAHLPASQPRPAPPSSRAQRGASCLGERPQLRLLLESPAARRWNIVGTSSPGLLPSFVPSTAGAAGGTGAGAPLDQPSRGGSARVSIGHTHRRHTPQPHPPALRTLRRRVRWGRRKGGAGEGRHLVVGARRPFLSGLATSLDLGVGGTAAAFEGHQHGSSAAHWLGLGRRIRCWCWRRRHSGHAGHMARLPLVPVHGMG